jgi:hypothetical protein
MPEMLRTTATGRKGFGESPQEHLRNLLAYWARWPPERVDDASAALVRHLDELRSQTHHDPLAPPLTDGQQRRARARLAECRNQALPALDEIAGAGLEARVGQYLRPLVVVSAAADRDWRTWVCLNSLALLLGVADGPAGHPKTRHLCVCDACTVVFSPQGRKGHARHCPPCQDQSHPVTAPPPSYDTMPMARGDRVRIRLPVPRPFAVESWHEVTLGRCAECNKLFHGRSDKVVCSDACGARWDRRVK